jgi:purine-nucleoside phosphorylase
MIDAHLKETLAFIAQKSDAKPRLAFVLGSGLSGFAKHIKVTAEFKYQDLPHFACSGVEGHPGRLTFGDLDGVSVVVMQGRLHAYEGLSPEQVIYPVRVLAALGVGTVVLTNAAGGLRDDVKPGDFMVIRDHINMTGINPLRGANWARGHRFVDMTEAYDVHLIEAMRTAMNAEGVPHFDGVYVGVMGPSYETAAEVRYFGSMGGGAVGMSTVFETLAARHAGLKVAGLSCITNLGTGLSNQKLTHDEVKEVAQQTEEQFARALKRFTREIAPTL